MTQDKQARSFNMKLNSARPQNKELLCCRRGLMPENWKCRKEPHPADPWINQGTALGAAQGKAAIPAQLQKTAAEIGYSKVNHIQTQCFLPFKGFPLIKRNFTVAQAV